MISQRVRLGDRDVGRIGLGTNRLRNTQQNVAFIRAAVDAGVQMIDTAHLYTSGESEQTIGRALSPVPEGVVVATKGGYGGAGRGRPEVLRAEVEESLKRLRVDRIALYYLHRAEALLDRSIGRASARSRSSSTADQSSGSASPRSTSR